MKCQPQRKNKNEAVEVAVLGDIALDHTQCTRRLAKISYVSGSSLTKMSNAHKQYPYKLKLI